MLLVKQQFVKFSFIELTNGRSQTNWDQKSNLLLLQQHYRSQKFRVNFVIYIRYITIKKTDDYENIYSVNPLYLRINHANRYIEKKNGNKYLVFDYTDENKELLKKYTDIWDEIKNEIKTINGDKENDYGKDYKKIKFISEDHLPLNKSLKFHAMTIIIRSVFEEDGKLYPQLFLDDTFNELV